MGRLPRALRSFERRVLRTLTRSREFATLGANSNVLRAKHGGREVQSPLGRARPDEIQTIRRKNCFALGGLLSCLGYSLDAENSAKRPW